METNEFVPKIPTRNDFNSRHSRIAFNNITIYTTYNNNITKKKKLKVKEGELDWEN